MAQRSLKLGRLQRHFSIREFGNWPLQNYSSSMYGRYQWTNAGHFGSILLGNLEKNLHHSFKFPRNGACVHSIDEKSTEHFALKPEKIRHGSQNSKRDQCDCRTIAIEYQRIATGAWKKQSWKSHHVGKSQCEFKRSPGDRGLCDQRNRGSLGQKRRG